MDFFFCLSIFLSAYMFVCLSACLIVYLSLFLFVYYSIILFFLFCPCVYLLICMFPYMSIFSLLWTVWHCFWYNYILNKLYIIYLYFNYMVFHNNLRVRIHSISAMFKFHICPSYISAFLSGLKK